MSDTHSSISMVDEPTVNAMIRLHPPTVEVFNRFGIDACCGGAVPITEAALRDGASPDDLWAALREVRRVGR